MKKPVPHNTLSDKDFKYVCELVYETTGIVLDERKREMIYRRLTRRTRQLKLKTFGCYCDLLRSGGEEELANFFNIITTNLTSFFREEHHFNFLRDKFIPEHMKRRESDRKLRIWSSACSTGEEPYSLAIALHEAMGSSLDVWNVKILATDLDTEVLNTAKSGVYKDERIESLSEERKNTWFKAGTGNNESMIKVNPKLQNLITFNALNLLEKWPMKGVFDVIVCRNVLIYFDRKTQNDLVSRFTKMLRPNGILMLGHSESIDAKSFGLTLIGKTTFRNGG